MNIKNNLIFVFMFFIILNDFSFGNTTINEILITTNISKANGTVWDGFGNATIGVRGGVGLAIPTSNPPDIMLCVVLANSLEKEKCYYRAEKRKKYSLCHNSYDCEFKIEIPNGELIGIVIFDIDFRNNDLIDTVILKKGKTRREEVDKINHKIRKITKKYSKVFSNGERQRRKRKNKVCVVIKNKKCKLSQSFIKFM